LLRRCADRRIADVEEEARLLERRPERRERADPLPSRLDTGILERELPDAK
jgi:hypothetical protein